LRIKIIHWVVADVVGETGEAAAEADRVFAQPATGRRVVNAVVSAVRVGRAVVDEAGPDERQAELRVRLSRDVAERVVVEVVDDVAGTEDGQPKVFRDSAVENLHEFFERFRHLNVRSNANLDDLVNRAQRIVRNVEPQQLRDNQQLRQQVATQLSSVEAVLDGLLVDRPRRNNLRRK